MEFTMETVYDQKTFTVMARTLRQTMRKRRSKRSRIWGAVVMLLAVLLLFLSNRDGFVLNMRTVVTVLVMISLVVVFVWEDQLNGYIARKRNLPGMETMTATFTANGFHTVTEIGNTDWQYDKIVHIAETAEYFVFMFSANHAQLHDKRTIAGGTVDDFRSFIEAQTGKTVEQI